MPYSVPVLYGKLPPVIQEPDAIQDDEDAIIIETGSDRVKMKFKKWCISTVDTVKEQPQQAGQPEKKGFFGFGKKKDSDETKATKE